jgi:PAS domain S-box-containing protein
VSSQTDNHPAALAPRDRDVQASASGGLWRDHPALMVALTYGFISLTYIALSDQIVSWLVRDSDRLTLMQTYKGWAFISATTVLIYLLVRHSVNQMRAAQRERLAIDERYRRMIETTNEGVVVAGDDARCQYVNQTFADMIGSTPAEILRKRCGECVCEEHQPMVERMLTDPERDGPRRFDCQLKHSNGSLVWTMVSASPIVDPLTGRASTLFMLTDITARKQAELAIEKNLEVQRGLLNELDHRVRNNLSSLSAIIDLSRGSTASVDEFAQAIGGRVQAMAKAHALGGPAGSAGMDLGRIFQEMVPPLLRARVSIEGPPVHADRPAMVPLAMLMHEMLERSERTGALAEPGGRVRVTWVADDDPAAEVDVCWRESPAPERASAPSLRRHGDIVEGLVRSDLRGSITPTNDGFHLRLTVRRQAVHGE